MQYSHFQNSLLSLIAVGILMLHHGEAEEDANHHHNFCHPSHCLGRDNNRKKVSAIEAMIL